LLGRLRIPRSIAGRAGAWAFVVAVAADAALARFRWAIPTAPAARAAATPGRPTRAPPAGGEAFGDTPE